MKISTIPSIDTGALEAGQSLIGLSPVLDLAIRFAAQWLVYLVPVALLGLWLWDRYGNQRADWHDRRVRLIEFTAAGLLGWQVISGIVKLFIYRDRPLLAGTDVKELFFHRPNNSFPSDHTAFFASFTAFCYAMGWTRAGHWMLAATIVIASSRIITGVHWFTDILAGLAIGIAAGLILHAIEPWFRRRVAEPIEQLVSRFGL